MDRLMYSVPETCRYLSLSRSKVYALMASGRLRSVKIDGARRVLATDLADYVQSLPGLSHQGRDRTDPIVVPQPSAAEARTTSSEATDGSRSPWVLMVSTSGTIR